MRSASGTTTASSRKSMSSRIPPKSEPPPTCLPRRFLPPTCRSTSTLFSVRIRKPGASCATSSRREAGDSRGERNLDRRATSNYDMIEVDDLRKQYGDLVAVGGVSFRVEPGTIFGLLGPNGAGKSTTIGCISGLLRPTSGRIRVLGHDVVLDS